MKFYFSSKWHLKDDVAQMRDRVIEAGHVVPVDWTTRAFERDYEDFSDSGRFASEEVDAICDCDVFVHLSDLGGKGKYVDLGIALAARKNAVNPRIYVIGSKASESQFYFHPFVKRIVTDSIHDGLEKVLSDVNNKE